MDIKEFAEEMRTKLLELLPEVSDIKIERCLKNNSVALTSLIISEEGNNICPTMYVDEYFKQYTHGRCQDSILADMTLAYHNAQLHSMIDVSFIHDWKKVKPLVAFKLINTEKNQELLQNIPHKEIMDLSMVFYIVVEDVSGTILIYNSHCDMWGIEWDELINVAQENTPVIKPISVTSMQDVAEKLLEDEAKVIPDELKMYILTNQHKSFGAAAMFYPHSVKAIADRLNSDLYILPSSTHEVLLVPTQYNDVEALKDMVETVNNTSVAAEDILGYNIYLYSRMTDEFSLAT